METLPKFITTVELGRLARWLRLLGFDCVFFDRAKKRDIIIEALRADRVILTRDSRLSRFKGVRMVHIEKDFVKEQLPQVMNTLHLKAVKKNIFTRCVKCNRVLLKAGKEGLKSKIPPHVYKTKNEFTCCPGCNKVYWKGTHLKLANSFLDKMDLPRIGKEASSPVAAHKRRTP